MIVEEIKVKPFWKRWFCNHDFTGELGLFHSTEVEGNTQEFVRNVGKGFMLIKSN